MQRRSDRNGKNLGIEQDPDLHSFAVVDYFHDLHRMLACVCVCVCFLPPQMCVEVRSRWLVGFPSPATTHQREYQNIRNISP